METFFVHLLQANLILLIMYAFYYAVLQKETSFRFNRLYLLMTWPVALILPALKLPQLFSTQALPTVDDFLLLLAMSTEETAAVNTTTQLANEKFIFSWPYLVGAALAIGSLLLGFYLIKRLFVIKQLRNRHQFRKEDKGHYALVYTEGKLPVFSFFNTIYWHEQTNLNKSENEAILNHELAHVNQLHSWDVILSELFILIFWYNPIAWQLKKSITDNHEFLADQHSSKQLTGGSYYQLLAGQYAMQYNLSLGNFFYKSTIINRLMMLNKTTKIAKWKLAMTIPVLSLMVIGFGCETSLTGFKSDELEPEATEVDLNIQTDEEEVFSIVEEQAVPLTGIQSFYDYVAKELREKYPKAAQRMGIEGTVYIQFIIEKDGALSDVRAVRGIGGGCDEIAIELVSNSEKWIPGMQRGRAVRSRRIIPIKFTLDGEKETPDNTRKETYAISDNEEIFSQVEKQAEPVNGIQAFYDYISTVTKPYPAQAKEMGIEGTVYVQFIIEKDGSLSDAQVVRGIGGGCDELAAQVVANSPKWLPGVHHGEVVRTRRIVPIKFTLK